ncbi:hypothetical protein BDF19DRAFT_435329 [Syncephalis fuscata]|nr:hypothetical protein BDF19DRAFT_435329 [Syncephalis fuscata]
MTIHLSNICHSVQFNHNAVTHLLRTIINNTPYKGWSVSLQLCGLASIRQLNQLYRNKNQATDVLSFPFHLAQSPGVLPAPLTPQHCYLGDIYVSVPYVRKHCLSEWLAARSSTLPASSRVINKWLCSAEEISALEIRLRELYVHSICHLMGYDHETDEQYSKMLAVEDAILDKLPSDPPTTIKSIFKQQIQ